MNKRLEWVDADALEKINQQTARVLNATVLLIAEAELLDALISTRGFPDNSPEPKEDSLLLRILSYKIF